MNASCSSTWPTRWPARLRLAGVRLERRELTVDRRHDHEVAQVVARDRKVLVHRVERVAHARELVRAELLVQAQLLLHGAAQAPVARELRLEIVDLAFRRAARREQRLPPRELAREAIDLIVDVDELALIAQPALLEVLARRAQVVELLRELRLGADDLQLEVRVLERHERLAGRHERALLDVHGRDLPAFDGVEIDRRARHDVARDGDVLAKRVVSHLRHRDSLGADGERAVKPNST